MARVRQILLLMAKGLLAAVRDEGTFRRILAILVMLAIWQSNGFKIYTSGAATAKQLPISCL